MLDPLKAEFANDSDLESMVSTLEQRVELTIFGQRTLHPQGTLPAHVHDGLGVSQLSSVKLQFEGRRLIASTHCLELAQCTERMATTGG